MARRMASPRTGVATATTAGAGSIVSVQHPGNALDENGAAASVIRQALLPVEGGEQLQRKAARAHWNGGGATGPAVLVLLLCLISGCVVAVAVAAVAVAQQGARASGAGSTAAAAATSAAVGFGALPAGGSSDSNALEAQVSENISFIINC